MHICLNIRHKRIKLTALLALCPLFFFAQSLTGLWTGVLTNDSNSVRKDQSFEIALTEYQGKVYGYSRSEFIVNDTLYYIVKRVKGIINGDTCEVMDDEIISFNFPQKLDKGVKVYSSFYRNIKDSTWYLAGSWKTNKTKKYYSVTGKVDMKEEKDLSASKIFPHLEELHLANDVAFYRNRKKEQTSDFVKILEPEKKRFDADTTIKSESSINVKDAVAISNKTNPETQKIKTPLVTLTEDTLIIAAQKKPDEITRISKTIVNEKSKEISISPSELVQNLSKNNNRNKEIISPSDNKNAAIANTVIKKEADKQTDPVNNEEIKIASDALNQNTVKNNQQQKQDPILQISKKDAPIANTNQSQANKQPLTARNTSDTKKIATVNPSPIKQTGAETKKPDSTLVAKSHENTSPTMLANEAKEIKYQASITTNIEKKDIADVGIAAALIKERKSEFSQIVNFKSDSLELSLYDNGEVDGDTVSVLLNGEIIIAKLCLKASAFKKTVYIPSGNNEEFTMVLYAENLGKYPPNTGLLVVHDGDDVYNVHFSADFQKNAGVIFRRKK